MYCSKCGAPVQDDSRFCAKCGNKLSSSEVPGIISKDTKPISEVESLIRSIFSSGTLLILAIFMSVSLLIGTLPDSGADSVKISDFTYGDFNTFVTQISDTLKENISIPFVAVQSSLLAVIGIWILYGQAKSRSPRLKEAGLVIFKVISIVSIVAFGLGLLFMLVGGPIFAEYINRYSTVTITEEGYLYYGLWCGSMALSIIFYSFILSGISSLRKSLKYEKVVGKISAFIPASLFFVSALNVIFAAMYFYLSKFVPGISAALFAVICALGGYITYKLRSELSELNIYQ